MMDLLFPHAEWRIQIQQKGISIRDIRKNLQRVQASILRGDITGKRYYLPSCIGHKASKIYQAMGVARNESVRELM